MKTKTNLITVGQLVKELKEYEKKYEFYSVICCAPDDLTFGIVGAGTDEDGDLCLEVQEWDGAEGFDDVNTLLETLKEYDKKTKVYLAGYGNYMSIDASDGIFAEADEEDETVQCDVTVFGEYEEEQPSGQAETEMPRTAEKAKKNTRESLIETIVLCVLTLAVFIGLIYNVYALFAKTGQPVWESVIWIVVCLVLLVIFIGTLYNSKD